MPKVGNTDIFDRAITLAKKSTMNQRHGAIIVKNGEIIGEGYNQHTTYMSHSFSCHAEVSAILSLKKKTKKYLEDATMIVVRISNHTMSPQHLKMSKPCEKCTQEIIKHGIRKIFYSTNIEQHHV
jgi:deoxycytidylate deaminase